MTQIPATGLPKEQVLATLQAFKGRDMDWKAGKVYCYVYNPGEDPSDLLRQAYTLYMSENGLDPTVFPSMLKLETDLVRMVANLLRGDENVVGHVSTGGTESIMLAVKTARDKARLEHPEISTPEMVLPRTAHAAFHKAAHYLGVRPVIVEINPETFRVEPAAMEAAITPNTILMVVSAPNYSQGVVDPVAEVAAIAQKHGLLCHVDGCVGGIHLSFMRKLGHAVPDFDFSVPGVTSISTDLHKYGYAAKGASVILYRDRSIRRYQIFACTDTTGYTLINPTVLSSRGGGAMAAAWAILNFEGEAGYQRIVADVQAATRQLIEGVNAIPGLRVLGRPDMCMFSFASDEVNLYQVADEMTKRGWYIQPQFSTALTPRNLHLSISYGVIPNTEALLADLRECVELVRSGPQLDTAFIREAAAGFAADPSPEAFEGLMALAGMSGTELPSEMAFINEFLDALPDPLCNQFLINFFNDLYV